MKNSAFQKIILGLVFAILSFGVSAQQTEAPEAENTWQQPAEEIMEVLNAPQLPWVWTSPRGTHMIMADPISYPTLEELAAPMHELAGIRVNPKNNNFHGRHGGTSARLLAIESKKEIDFKLPEKAELMSVSWTADGEKYALTVDHKDHLGLWVGSVDAAPKKLEGIHLNPLLGDEVTWLPDQEHLLIRKIPNRGAVPEAPAIPAGPIIKKGADASARSTYEARNLLETAHDDKLFEYHAAQELVVLDPMTKTTETLGESAIYGDVSYSPDGKYILVEKLKGPWSHEVAYWRFAHTIEVWDSSGDMVATIADLPLADAVPVHGVPEGPRSVRWRATSPHTLYWTEALDGGNPVAEVPHRDKLMRLEAPFSGTPEQVFKAKHRIVSSSYWGEDGLMMLVERERIKRRIYAWLLDVDKGTERLWYELDQSDQYNDPGRPEMRQLDNGQWVVHQSKGGIYFSGPGASEQGNRPFLDLKDVTTGKTERLFRASPEKYEYFVAFAGGDDQFVLRSESPTEVPNYYLADIGKKVKAEDGEGTRKIKREPITEFTDPTPQLREIKTEIVTYEREDGVTLNFKLKLPPGYQEGEARPTVLYAYPLEYSSAGVAGQVRGSDKRFMRIWGPSHLYFLLNGYVVLDQTAMPMVGDPETTYDTFVEQLVDDAEAAVNKAVEMGVADKDKIGVIGHSHGGLMVANLLAHTDLFKAGIARSGSYNKTNQPFGFQSERRSLFDARDVYIQVSPTFFADKVNEPVLIIHGNSDSNPGTLTPQSEVFYEAVRGSGGTARLVLLPFEDHGYRAKETVEHVLWEQLRWFDKYVKGEESLE